MFIFAKSYKDLTDFTNNQTSIHMKKLTLMAFVMLFSCITAQHIRAEGISLITNGDGSTDDVSCFFIKSSIESQATHAEMDGNAFKVEIAGNPDPIQTWATSFGIKSLQKISAGTKVRFKTLVKCTDSRSCNIQAHRDELGNHIYWQYLGFIFTTQANEWITYEWTGIIPAEADGCDIACINLGSSAEAATIWFKDIEWEILDYDEDGIIATFLGESQHRPYVSYTGKYNINDSYSDFITASDGTDYLALETKTLEKPEDTQVCFWMGAQQAHLNGKKSYVVTFDIMGTSAADNQLILFYDGSESGLYIPFNITKEWQRITLKIIPQDYTSSFALYLGQYEGTVFITNVFIYDAAYTPKLPYLPTVDLTNTPIGFEVALPLAIGDTLQLSTIVFPRSVSYDAVNWESLNENIATITANGIVTGISEGISYITVTSGSIPNLHPTVLIRVHAAEPVAVSSITIDPMIVDNAKTGDRINLTATVLPENADDKTVTWSSSNESVATVSTDGVVDIVAPGTAVITATANDGSGVKGVCLISGLSSLDDVMYTSPTDKKDVYTVDGKLIMRSATRDDLNTLAPGIYLVGDMKIAIR